MAIPKYDNLFNLLLVALHKLGSSASISELEQSVAKILELSEADLEEPHESRHEHRQEHTFPCRSADGLHGDGIRRVRADETDRLPGTKGDVGCHGSEGIP